MPRVRGWTEHELLGRERVFEGLIAKAVKMSLRPLSATLNRTLVAAGAPTLSPEPDPTGPVLSPAQTTVVTATWTHYVDSELFPYLAQTFVDAAGAVRAGTEAALDVSVPPVTDSYAVSYLAAATNRLVNVGDVVWSAVRDQLVEGYAAGESTHQLAARVREVAGFTRHRAVAVARTEVVGAANAGSLAQLQLAGFTDEECSKRWMATEDERTRIAHHVADGQTVPLNQPFSVGGEGLQFPGDPRGRADNIIQCRCTLEYVFAGDAEPEEDVDLLTAGAFKRWLARLHPRGKGGLFVEKGAPEASAAPPKMVKYIPTKPRNEFHILSKAQRGKSGDVQYAPGMYGRYGAAGVMIRHRDAGGTDRFLVVQRSTGKYNRWKWQLPGGALDEKETPAQGAAREPFEEIGATPDVLDQLKLVGEHKVTLPVPGKDPWSYTNIAADIDKPFKPIVDAGELGAARWLTADQLHEMRGRGRLVAPFAEHLDTILAKFPDVPLTAAGLKNAAKHSLEKAFDEAKHPRAPKGVGHGHGGEFIKKGVGVGQVQALQPIKINTKVVYNTKYTHNAVVAQRTNKYGAKHELRWNAKWKNGQGGFELWSDYGAGGPLQFVKIMGKGETYQEFGKNDTEGWTAPSSNVQDYGQLLKTMNDLETQSPPLKNTPELPPVETKTKTPIVDAPKVSPPGKKKWPEDPVNLPVMEQVEIDNFFKNLTEEKYFAFTEAEKKIVGKTVQNQAQEHDNIAPAEKISQFGSSAAADYLAQEIDDLTTEELKVWLYDHLYEESWNDMSQPEQEHLWQQVVTHGPQIVTIFNDLIKGGSGNLDEQGNLEFEPTTENSTVANLIEKMSKSKLKDYIEQIDHVQWSGLTKNEQITLISQMHKHNLGDILSDKINSEKSVKAKKTLPLGVPSTGQISAYSTDHVKSVASIGTPETDANVFLPLTVQSAHGLQATMLAKSGKKDWTPEQKKAVAEYTTSVGYQTTNAVMRNDTERMKMFSPAQLHQGVGRAVHLQAAMTPLTESVKLHRGTGAQAFGFKNTDVSFDELSQLVGSTISDKGFLSTSVVPPTSAGVGFDYATKKPIKMIINAPTGTPGVYVSSVTPGYSHENEFILAAGTTLRIDSVAGATPADKAKYGSTIKHLVVATVVPTSHAAPAKHVVPQPAAVIPPVNAPKLQLPKPGAPLKITTGVIYPKKGSEYTGGQVIALRYRPDGRVEQLFWSASTKKYGYRISTPDKTAWQGFPESYGKGEAFDKFVKDPNFNQGWTLPAAGANVGNDLNSPAGQIQPSISGNPTGIVIQHATEVKESKTPKLSATDIKAQYGVISKMPQQQFDDFIGALKYNGPVGQINLNSTGPTVFKALAAAVAGHNEKNPDNPLNLLQGIKLLDAKLTPKDKPNAGLYEAKVVDWLQTAAGKKNAQSFIDWAEQLAKAPKTTSAPSSLASSSKVPISPANVKTPGEIGTPKSNVVSFENITHNTASKMNSEMREKYGNWNAEQLNAIHAYTGSSYGSYNNALRSGSASEGMISKIATLQSAMAPVTRSFTVHRGTDGIGDLVGPHTSFAELEKLVNEEVIDKGFLSTSVGSTAAFNGKKFILEIDIPEGTPGAYVANHSSVGVAEREFIIAAGTKYKILAVDNKSQWQTVIKLRVIA